MGLRALNTVLLACAFSLMLASGTQREKSVLAEGHEDAVHALEVTYLTRHDPTSLRELAQGYLDAGAPGLALAAIDGAPKDVKSEVHVQHVYARALLDSGRASDALVAEEGVLAKCGDEHCDTWLIASATRRADILRELEKLGVDDAQAYPESASVAYHAATRQVTFQPRLSVQ
jgi:hypothetical protein